MKNENSRKPMHSWSKFLCVGLVSVTCSSAVANKSAAEENLALELGIILGGATGCDLELSDDNVKLMAQAGARNSADFIGDVGIFALQAAQDIEAMALDRKQNYCLGLREFARQRNLLE